MAHRFNFSWNGNMVPFYTLVASGLYQTVHTTTLQPPDNSISFFIEASWPWLQHLSFTLWPGNQVIHVIMKLPNLRPWNLFITGNHLIDIIINNITTSKHKMAITLHFLWLCNHYWWSITTSWLSCSISSSRLTLHYYDGYATPPMQSMYYQEALNNIFLFYTKNSLLCLYISASLRSKG